ncbi:MAG: SpoIIE family protein phosphatase [Gemmatimonadales bacterium]
MGPRAVTTVEADRIRLIDWGVATVALPGQETSGDGHLVRRLPGGALLAAIDGLGHGAAAAAAARRAVDTLVQHESETAIGLVRTCHRALAGTRGVTMSLASLNAADDTLTWLAIGNVEGVLLRADPRTSRPMETILMRAGVVGLELPRLQATVTSIAPGDTIILATDGIRRSFMEDVRPAAGPQSMADYILRQFAKGTDDALVLVARYRGSENGP